MTVAGVVTIAAVGRIKYQRRAEVVAQVGDKAGEFGTGNFQFVYQCLAADGVAPTIEQAMQSVEVVRFAQGRMLVMYLGCTFDDLIWLRSQLEMILGSQMRVLLWPTVLAANKAWSACCAVTPGLTSTSINANPKEAVI